MCSLQGFAAGEDLICRPRDVFDAGFRVHAKIDENGVLNTEVMAVSGWGGDKKEFSGPSFLLYERINEGCVFKIVDKRDSPNTIIVLKVGGEDFLQRLNGENLSINFQGKEMNVFNKLSCFGSKKLTDQLKSMCQ